MISNAISARTHLGEDGLGRLDRRRTTRQRLDRRRQLSDESAIPPHALGRSSALDALDGRLEHALVARRDHVRPLEQQRQRRRRRRLARSDDIRLGSSSSRQVATEGEPLLGAVLARRFGRAAAAAERGRRRGRSRAVDVDDDDLVPVEGRPVARRVARRHLLQLRCRQRGRGRSLAACDGLERDDRLGGTGAAEGAIVRRELQRTRLDGRRRARGRKERTAFGTAIDERGRRGGG